MNSFFSKKWVALVASALLIVAGITVARTVPAYLKARKELSAIRAQEQVVARRNDELEANYDYRQSREYQERQARLQLNYKKPDEKVVYVYDRASVSPSPLVQPRKSWIQWLKEKLGLRD